ncbi:hypothetical protein Kpho02_22890 [Kitasatospora phosalacinea]|uniref:ScoMcrA-like SRA domain-containing protein n=1 Tax=Kitasatospora phosalacinea TaxID=2065 RepID=A0A9W6Q4H4_9ACTN|nr:hypothetical protein [Kitasatospora phosalacinea]GLW69990.1 hypothetical protein Kpho02_22890 [Kitasatospora phosalacinea]
MTTSLGPMAPGDIRTRAQIRQEFGGSPQGGICPSDEKKSVNLYSDPSIGEHVGYYDGWLAEEDELGPVFEYTGAGLTGDQTFDGPFGMGNRSILRHAEQGRKLRVFIRAGTIKGTATATHRYVGTFNLDQRLPYVWRKVRGENGEVRSVIVFRLRPDGAFKSSAADTIPAAKKTTVEFVQFQPITASMLNSGPATQGALSLPSQRQGAKSSARKRTTNASTEGVFVVSEAFNTEMSLRAATAASIAVRREAALTKSYRAHLEAAGHTVGAFQIRVEGLSSTLRTDLYDATSHVLYEAKGSSSREDVRMAIGQLLDYSRYVKTDAHPHEPRQAILLPAAPDPDIRVLLERHQIGLVHQLSDGQFTGPDFTAPS